jgi:hypothetical protein
MEKMVGVRVDFSPILDPVRCHGLPFWGICCENSLFSRKDKITSGDSQFEQSLV